MGWELYDRLIEAIPADATVTSCSIGRAWTAVRAEEGLGLAMSFAPQDAHHGMREAGAIAGRPLRDVAAWIKSWDFARAAVGLAAINAWANAPSVLKRHFDLEAAPTDENAFTHFAPACAGKSAAMIGHFKDVKQLSAAKQVYVLERSPEPGDLPDPACEYVLPECAVVFITSVTLTNKTLPRLLELSRDALVVLVGPGTPMHPLLFDYGVTALSGLSVPDIAPVLYAVREGGGVPAIRRSGGIFMNLTAAHRKTRENAA